MKLFQFFLLFIYLFVCFLFINDLFSIFIIVFLFILLGKLIIIINYFFLTIIFLPPCSDVTLHAALIVDWLTTRWCQTCSRASQVKRSQIDASCCFYPAHVCQNVNPVRFEGERASAQPSQRPSLSLSLSPSVLLARPLSIFQGAIKEIPQLLLIMM